MLAALIRFSVRRAALTVALALALLGFGVSRMFGASLDVFPEFAPTQVVIQTEAPGLAAPWVEALVTQPIERAIQGLEGLQSLRSQSIPGLSVVTVIFTDRSDIHRHRQSVAERLAQAVGELPPGIAPNLTPLTSSASTVLGLGLTAARDANGAPRLDALALRSLVDRTLRPHLLAVTGVADVNVFGGERAQWQIRIDPARLAAARLSLGELAAAAREATGVRAAGFVESANQRIALGIEPPGVGRGADDPQANGEIARELERAVVRAPTGNGAALLLRDVATIAPGGAPRINAALIDGTPGVFLLVQGQLGANTRDVTLALDAALDRIAPVVERSGATLHRDLFRPAGFIETAVRNVQRDVAIGAALVVVVLFGFLYNVRTAVVSALAIPLSLVAAVEVMRALGQSLNIMVLGGLAIALGEVVDDAIIDCENIYRRLRENRLLAQPRPVREVVVTASMEVRSSVVYATFIVALAFVPLLTLSGVAGKLFAPLGAAYIAAILASLVVAVTVTPALSMLLLGAAKLPAAEAPLVAWLKPRYRRVLVAVERRAGVVLGVVGALIVVGLGTLPLFRSEFLPPLKEGHYIAHMAAVPGTSLDESMRLGERVSAALLAIDGVKSVAQWIGRAENGADTFGPHYSELEIEIGQVSGAEQRRLLAAIRETLAGEDDDAAGDGDAAPRDADGHQAGFAGLQFGVNTFLTERIGETVSGFPADVVVNLYGQDLDALERDGQRVAALLAALPGAREVGLLAPPGAPQLSVRLRAERLAKHGLTAGEVMDAVQIAYDGLAVGRLQQRDAATPLVLVLPPEARRDASGVARLALVTPLGATIELGEVADVEMVQGRAKILRDGGRRVQTATANIAPGQDAEAFVATLEQRLAKPGLLAAGHHAEVLSKAAAQRAARVELIQVALLSGLGVAGLLLLAFGSARHLALVFVNLPFALIGGVAAALATGGVLSLGSVVGFVTLFGITLRNSIMLVSHYQHLCDVERLPWNLDTALRGAMERLPSILMTALVTGLGLAPLALGSAEPGREIEGPMATMIVGGLVSSTLLNLLVLPTVLLRFGRFGRAGVPETAAA
ncbi:MAG TPA: efflux RND transporter permease subunit [Methylibium sp.]|uniref:efflux RND transporter permease subunit n=1 Tax=Methylibium sp. TaxID=2067992 RepID=UPI002DB856EA|nr:efflux RND transporter permease subunit [Methylibium sp.]HEU4460915.1 efflux RND transporter permease subunit [Methylibium sp.]